MSLIDFLLQLLVMVLGSVISAIILALLGFFTIKRMISRAMDSKEVKEFTAGFEALKAELEKLKDEITKLFEGNPKGYVK